MAPLAGSGMQALKLGHYPGRRQRRSIGCLGVTLLWSYFSVHLPCWASTQIFLRTGVPRTPYPAALTLMCSYFSSHLPCCAKKKLFLHPLTLLCPFFSSHLPCCVFNFFRTYPAVPKKICFCTHLSYPAMPI